MPILPITFLLLQAKVDAPPLGPMNQLYNIHYDDRVRKIAFPLSCAMSRYVAQCPGASVHCAMLKCVNTDAEQLCQTS